MMVDKVLFSSNCQEWETPDDLFEELDKEFHFTLDPCATLENAKCAVFYSKETNGLLQDWRQRVFCNPPFGKNVGQWVEHAYWNVALGYADVVVCLLPARTDTKWFHDYCLKGEVRFIRGRLRFKGAKNPAPFPSIVVVFRRG